MNEEFQKKNHPDDLFFKEVMSKPSSAKAYLQHFSPEVCKTLDLDSLTHQNESFVDSQLDLFQSDIIYRCKIKDSEEEIYISFIWEHKSSPETYVSLQIGLYILLALYKMSKEKGRKLEIIIPFLFYNGAQNWHPKTIHELYKHVPHFELFKAYVPQYHLIFKNIVKSEEKELTMIQDAFFRSAMFAMASRNNPLLILQRISRIFDINEEDHILVILNYIHHFSLTSKMIAEALLESDNPLKSKVMSTIESLGMIYRKEGLEEGLEKNLEEKREIVINMYKEGFDIGTIVRLLNTTFDFVTKAIEEYTSEN